jgi:hypothetical protein
MGTQRLIPFRLSRVGILRDARAADVWTISEVSESTAG